MQNILDIKEVSFWWFFDKKSSSVNTSVGGIKYENMSNQNYL